MALPLRILLIVVLVSLGFSSWGQNLVPNPSFENLKNSPNCWTGSGKQEFDAQIYDWTLPSEGTSDLYSTQLPTSCITAMPVSEYPEVYWLPKGSQLPRTGTTFAGIKPFPEDRREYLQVKLLCPLIPGEEYYAEMYVSLAENTDYAQNSLAMYFSENEVYHPGTEMLSFTPQIMENAIVEDTVNWVKISGNFIASTSARYLIIGNFSTVSQVQTKFLGDKSEFDFPYYYIDDVMVEKVNPASLVVTGNTTICKGDKLQLLASGWSDISWYTYSNQLIKTGSSLATLFHSTGSLIVKGKDCAPLADTIEITVNPLPSIALGNDTLICSGTTVQLHAGAGLQNYQWQDGSTSEWFDASMEGKYKVKAFNSFGCSASDSMHIGFYKDPAVNLGKDLLMCNPEGNFNVSTQQAYDQYLWNNGANTSSIDYSSEGTYSVKITNICGAEASDTVTIRRIVMTIPNLITPNGDGFNEQFEILGVENGKGSLSVFNRFGAQIYTNEMYSNKGIGEVVSEGIYFYEYSYPGCDLVKGWLHVVK